MRALAASLLVLLGCGGDDTRDTFIVRAVAASGMEGAGPRITPEAVDRIDIVLDPADNVRFDAVNYPPFEDDVIVRVSPAGEYVLSLSRAWIDRNRVPTENSWLVDIPLYIDGLQTPIPRGPSMRVLFIQFGGPLGEDFIGEVARTLDPWPPMPDAQTTVTVTCRPGYDTECSGAAP